MLTLESMIFDICQYEFEIRIEWAEESDWWVEAIRDSRIHYQGNAAELFDAVAEVYTLMREEE